jgi:DNA repair exonuclease SbcCD ATPase subunit
MLGRVQSRVDSSNVSDNMITEPTFYLEKMKTEIEEKQKTLRETSETIKKSVEELETNINLIKQRLSALENVKTELEKELLKKSDTTEYDDLKSEKQKVDTEINQKLTEIEELERKIESKEAEWRNNKMMLITKLREFNEGQLMPYLENIENTMKLTNAKIEASNQKLTKYMTGEMDFGMYDPFVSIGNKFQEKLVNRNELFNNHFGNDEEEEHEDEEHEDEEETVFGNTRFGKCGEEHEEESDEELMEFDEDSDSDSDSESESYSDN